MDDANRDRAPARRILEICVDDAAGVAAAVAGGADRIELCSALAVGGLTPSAALTALAVRSAVPVHVMIRPRAGDFVHDRHDVALMCDEIARAIALGAAGIVVGATDAAGDPDRDALARFRAAATGVAAVFHRAIDLAPDPCAAIETACALGYDHVLSSGGHRTAAAGAGVLADMVRAADGRLAVIAGAGVTAANVAALIQATGVHQVHASAGVPHVWNDSRIAAFGFGTAAARRTNRSDVAAIRRALDA